MQCWCNMQSISQEHMQCCCNLICEAGLTPIYFSPYKNNQEPFPKVSNAEYLTGTYAVLVQYAEYLTGTYAVLLQFDL